MKKRLIAITAIFVFISLMLVNAQATTTVYYLKEDFNNLSGWTKVPDNMYVTMDNGEVKFDFPVVDAEDDSSVRDYIYKKIDVNRSLDEFTIEMNGKIKDNGEPNWNSSAGSSSEAYLEDYTDIRSDKGNYIRLALSSVLYNWKSDPAYDSHYNIWVTFYLYSSEDGFSTSLSILSESNLPHNEWYGGAVKVEVKRASPISYEVTVHRYEGYNFTGEQAPYKTIVHFNGNVTDISTTSSMFYYLDHLAVGDGLTGEARVDKIYIYGSGEKTEGTPQNVEATNTTLYLLPAVLLGIGIFTAIVGNPRYTYLILTAFILFGVVAVINSQYLLSATGFIPAIIYGYSLKKGGVLFE